MSDAVSEAVKEKRLTEEYLKEVGWVKHNYGWIDPTNGKTVLFGQAAKIQAAREMDIWFIMMS